MQPDQGPDHHVVSLLSDEDRIDTAKQLMRLAERCLDRRNVSSAAIALEIAQGIVVKLAEQSHNVSDAADSQFWPFGPAK